MNNFFPGHYKPSEEDFAKIWRECVFILDTNVLLGLYRYPREAHDDLMRTFNQLADRLWIPHQVALEYQENRLEVISEQLGKYDEVIKIIDESRNNLANKLDILQLRKRHSVINPNNFLEALDKVFVNYRQELEKLKKEQPDISDDDKIRADVDQLFSSRIGKPPTEEFLKNIYDSGKERYDNLRPPGYLDKSKSKDDDQISFYNDLTIKHEYGDLIIWQQIIAEAIDKKFKNIIFVTDDEKGDWWCIFKGKTISPRHELVEEIKQKAGVDNFYMYNSARFLSYAKQYLGAEINQETINQVQEISEVNREIKTRLPHINFQKEEIIDLLTHWIISNNSELYSLDRSIGFPEFTYTINNIKTCVGIRYVRDPRFIMHRWRDLTYRGFIEISKRNCDVFIIVFVIDHDKNDNSQKWITDLEIPPKVKIQFFEVFKNEKGEIVDLHFLFEKNG